MTLSKMLFIQQNVLKSWKPLAAGIALYAMMATGCKKDNDGGDTVIPRPDSTSVSGIVSGVWKKGSVVIVKGHLEISKGTSLTIEEGVTVLMSDSTIKPEFIIKGNLYSMGTAANPVKITVPDAWKTDKNTWGALWGGLIASPDCSEILLLYTDLSYGGAVTTAESLSVKGGLYKATAGVPVPALYTSNTAGKVVVMNSNIHNFNEDAFYLEGGSVILAYNKFYTTGVANGEAINLKSGVTADAAYNQIYSPNTNGFKLSSTGDRTPQMYMVGYNNTIINAGWRRATTKGGSIWLEKAARADLYNNLLVNDRYGIKNNPADPQDNRTKLYNTYYYGYNIATVNQFQPGANDVLAGTNDTKGTTAGANDPMFENYPLDNAVDNGVFNTAWDLRLKAGSPALGKGKTDFTRLYGTTGLTLNGTMYKSPEPSTFAGALGTK